MIAVKPTTSNTRRFVPPTFEFLLIHHIQIIQNTFTADHLHTDAMGEIDGDLRQYTKEMNAALNGRGGGKPFFVQGSAQATEDEIRNFFEK